MRLHQYKTGPIKVNLPDENQSLFSIFHDMAELFGMEFQNEAVKQLRAQLKDVKPKPSIDYESDYTHITTSNVDTLVSVINAITELSTDDYKQAFLQVDIAALKDTFKNAKKNRPKPKDWQTGDVFSIPLLDNSFAFGQVLDKKHCTCALINIKSNNTSLSQETFEKSQPISILHLSNGDLLNNGHWQILFNRATTLNPNGGHGGRFGDIGSKSYGQCGVLEDLANAYWGLVPWNIMYDENYYDELLLKGVTRPITVIVLTETDRIKYRKEKFGIE
jgi:hypothetical protein